MWETISAYLKGFGEPASALLVLLCFLVLYLRLRKIDRQLSDIEKQIRTPRNST